MVHYKDRRQANKGQALESFIRFANERYRQKGLAVIDKQATEFIPIRDRSGNVCGAKVERKATVDFLGRYKHYPIAIEAKNSNDTGIRFDRVEQHQFSYMNDFTAEPGTIGLVVLSFNYKRFFVVPWVFWQEAYKARVVPGASRTKPVSVSAFGQTWDIPKKFSVRESDLNPLWEIPNHDFDFGLHYLKNVEQYITPPTQP